MHYMQTFGCLLYNAFEALELRGTVYDSVLPLQGTCLKPSATTRWHLQPLHLAHVHETVQWQNVYGTSCSVAGARECSQAAVQTLQVR